MGKILIKSCSWASRSPSSTASACWQTERKAPRESSNILMNRVCWGWCFLTSNLIYPLTFYLSNLKKKCMDKKEGQTSNIQGWNFSSSLRPLELFHEKNSVPPSLPLAFLLRPSSFLSSTHKSLNNVDAASGGNEVLMSLRVCPEPLKSFSFVPPSFLKALTWWQVRSSGKGLLGRRK